MILFLALSPAILAAAPMPDVLAQAEAARRAGDPARALALLEPLIRADPDNADILRRLGASYAAAGRHREAIATLERARALSPADRDIALALARARLWSGDGAGARRDAQAIGEADPGNAELPELLDSIARAGAAPSRGPSLSASVGGSAIRLSGGREQLWAEAVIAGTSPIGGGTTLSGDLEHIDREAAADTRLGLRIDRRLTGGGSVWIGGTATPNADFRERWSLRGGASVPLVAHLTFSIDGRYADYGSLSVIAVEPGIRLAPAGRRWAAELRSVNLFDEDGHRLGWSARLERTTAGDGLIFGGAATYPDTEAGITRRVRGAYAGIAAPLSSALTLRVTADGEHRARSYRRFGLTLGLSWRLPR